MATEQETEASRHTTAVEAAGKAHGPRHNGLREVLEGVERDLIFAALQESRGNKAKAARALGITERVMGIRVRRLMIDWRSLRTRSRRTAPTT